MSYYKSVPVVVEAYRFDGSGVNGMRLLEWLAVYGIKNAILYSQDSDRPSQLDLLIPHVKIAEAGDYIVRIPEKLRSQFRVMTKDHFEATYVSTPKTDPLEGL